MSDFPRIRPATVLQRIPKNGVADSAAMNAFMEQVVHDLSEIFSAVNGTVLPILDGLGAPGTNPGMDVVADGLSVQRQGVGVPVGPTAVHFASVDHYQRWISRSTKAATAPLIGAGF